MKKNSELFELAKSSSKTPKKLTLKALEEAFEEIKKSKPPESVVIHNWPALIEFIAFDGKPHTIKMGSDTYEISVKKK